MSTRKDDQDDHRNDQVVFVMVGWSAIDGPANVLETPPAEGGVMAFSVCVFTFDRSFEREN